MSRLQKSLAVDAARGWLFAAGGGSVWRARLDGSRRRLLHNGTAVGDVALDLQKAEVYWTDTWEGSVWCARYDGSRARRAARIAAAALAVHAGRLYWLDPALRGGSVVSAPLGNLSDHTVLVDNAGSSLKDILVWSRAAQTFPSNLTHATTEASNALDLDLDTGADLDLDPDVAAGDAAWSTCGGGGGCEALCLFGGRARCVCPHGELAPNGKNCTPYKSFIMYSRVTKIDSIHLTDERDLNSPYPPIQDKELMRNAIALAYSYNASRVFYSDIQRGAIHSARFDGSDHRVLLEQVGAVEGLVYDWTTDTLYWTCASAAALRAARLAPEGGGAPRARTVLRLRHDDRPRGIDIDPCEKRVYWTNWRANKPCIERALTSGGARAAIISSRVLMPNALALDRAARRLYWADARLDKIERAHLDGSHRQLVTQDRASHPFALAVAGDWLVWTDWVARGVFRAHKLRGGTEALRRDVPRPMGVVAVGPQHAACSSDPCAVLNGGCAEECHSEGGVARCACGAGRVLAADGRACGAAGGACGARWACAEGPCVPQALVCDGVPHCSAEPDASDEDLYYCSE
ncbi:prolow-density lipoprotein receptor-related protein 1-like [Ostrinia nubilalis]|uniref:prolow-density lipoprotein receptor-related protein 1-like n=1 Tax=Ostrinia nubilalis TaxID=29057 RepID=UPI0030824ACF